ncbi:sugar ABC transporter permease [Vagococcus lutrae]|uniref:carbohydrate ABC transporter permease n=1 Tax=Vagococcus lutrae TaxID=81947 RepID=UPI00200D208A|nr:sugar ABC transporter permease [Vagococcus lutrae]UQF71462.1 sugar ABC transporter permease [Vagococcus lutrae]
MKRKNKEILWGYLFISPFLIGFIIFLLGPMMFSFIGSFTDYNLTSKMSFIGLENFKKIAFKDDLFFLSLKNTIFYVVLGVPLTIAASLFFSILLNRQIKGISIYRTIFYLPAILSGVAVYVLWMQLLSPSSGLINTLLALVGIKGPAWLQDPNWTKPSLLIMKVWSSGGSMLLYLATLQNVPKTLYESAALDGAGALRRFQSITLPLITPIIFYDLVTSTIGSFQIFQEAYVMTDNGSGGPGNSLLFYNLHMWNKAFVEFDMGYAMAMSMLLFVLVILLTLVNLKLSKKWVFYAGG